MRSWLELPVVHHATRRLMAARQLNDSRQLVYTRASTRTNCTTNWNAQMNFRPEGYGGPTIVCLNSVDRRRCGQQARPSTTFVDYTIDAVAILFKSTVWDKVWEWSAEVLSRLEALPRDRSKEAKTSSMYSTGLIEFRRVTDRQTRHGHRAHKHRVLSVMR